MIAFTRTPGGLAEKWRFYLVPTVWVEGPTDIYFYEPVLDSLRCRMEPFYGVENSVALVKALIDHNYPFLVILDGDYGILNPTKSPHKQVIILTRYSFENFLWEKEAANKACLRHARCGDDKDLILTEMDRVVKHFSQELVDLVALDVAARQHANPPAAVPDHIEQIAFDRARPDVDPTKVAAIIAAVAPQLDPKTVKKAERNVRSFISHSCISHLLKGHFILGVLRRMFVRASAQESGSTTQLSNDVLTQLLAEMVWRRCKSKDHLKLRKRLRSIIRKLSTQYPASVAPAPIVN